MCVCVCVCVSVCILLYAKYITNLSTMEFIVGIVPVRISTE